MQIAPTGAGQALVSCTNLSCGQALQRVTTNFGHTQSSIHTRRLVLEISRLGHDSFQPVLNTIKVVLVMVQPR